MEWQICAWFALTGVLAGFLSGLLSIGGAFIMIPAFLAIFQSYFHFDSKFLMQLTLGTTMACMVVNATCTTLAHHGKKSVCWPVLARHWPLLCIGTFIGVALTDFFNADLIKACFGFYCIYSGYRMVTRKSAEPVARPTGAHRATVLLFGTLCGFTGTGGANLFVPYLMRSMGLDLKRAMGTAAAIQIPISIVGATSFLTLGLASATAPAAMPYTGAAGFVFVPAWLLVSAAAPYFNKRGVALAHRLPTARLKTIFGIFTLLVGLKMLHATQWV